MPNTKSCEEESPSPLLMHTQTINDSEETQVPYNSTEPDISKLSESIVATSHNDLKSIPELNDASMDKLQPFEPIIKNENHSNLSGDAATSESHNESENAHPQVEEETTENNNMIDNVKSSDETEIPSSLLNNPARTSINLNSKLSNLSINEETSEAFNSKDDNLTKNEETTEPQVIIDLESSKQHHSEDPLEKSTEEIIEKKGLPNVESEPVDNDIIGNSSHNLNVGTDARVFMEDSTTPHASTTTLTQQSQVPPNSLNIQNMTSLLSQSTGQEERFSDMKNLPANGPEIYDGRSGLPQEPKVQLSRNNHFRDLETTANVSTSGISTVTNQDSLIFQQSGLTLYNLNPHSTNNLNQGSVNPMNQYTLSRNISQQSLQRQESYLTFKAPDNLRKNIQSSSNNDTSFRNGNQVPETISTQEFKVSSKKERQEPKQNRTATHTNSLLSQQKQNQEEEEKLQSVIDIDLSSYLSAQEPEIDSRTQQKLWLQRENVANLNDFEDTQHAPAAIINQSTRFQYEQHSREYLHIRRFMNPMLDSLNRIKNSGVSKRRLSIENSTTEASSILGKSVRDASAKTKFQSTSLAKSMGLVKDNKSLNPAFENDLSDYKEIIKAMWNKDCDAFKGDNSDTSGMTNSSSTSTNITLQYQSNQGRPFTIGASPHYNYPASTAFARGNNTSFGHANHHSLNTPSIRR
ncbi:hypothetical protein CANINC_005063 [Pichia inconspicua]|uniref:Uncharacterized protein n=1 Tax=Pichia inconspicua TaxID=52247 RepID=A0A4V4NF41_9ASCO|nr:hypothetical protein CANINC_005063 [[Candida] inconspicua]